jgi:hypothetical protein
MDVIDVFYELTESDGFIENKESMVLINSIVRYNFSFFFVLLFVPIPTKRQQLENQGIEHLVVNMKRFQENDEQSQAIFNTLGILENLLEAKPDLDEFVASKTSIIEWIVNYIQKPEFTPIKLY